MYFFSHARARRMLHSSPESLPDRDKAFLAKHLQRCQECRNYSTHLKTLQPALARAMHARWDARIHPVKSSGAIRQRVKEQQMRQRSIKFFGLLAGIGAIILLIVYSPAILSIPFLSMQPSPVANPTPGFGTTQVSPQDGMVMVYVPEGEFTMGRYGEPNETPPHPVYLDAFWIDRTEVTNAMFKKFVESTGYVTDAEKRGSSNILKAVETATGHDGKWELVNGLDWRHPGGVDSNINGLESHPVVHVSWNDAQAYCTWAGRRLPTEAEWEKAAIRKAKDINYLYPWGNEADGSQLNFCEKNCAYPWRALEKDDGYAETAPVGSFPKGASQYGALDMSGNVGEWVADWYDADYYSKSPSSNPKGPATGEARVWRGGAWMFDENNLARSAYRSSNDSLLSNPAVGFRCALTP